MRSLLLALAVLLAPGAAATSVVDVALEEAEATIVHHRERADAWEDHAVDGCSARQENETALWEARVANGAEGASNASQTRGAALLREAGAIARGGDVDIRAIANATDPPELPSFEEIRAVESDLLLSLANTTGAALGSIEVVACLGDEPDDRRELIQEDARGAVALASPDGADAYAGALGASEGALGGLGIDPYGNPPDVVGCLDPIFDLLTNEPNERAACPA